MYIIWVQWKPAFERLNKKQHPRHISFKRHTMHLVDYQALDDPITHQLRRMVGCCFFLVRVTVDRAWARHRRLMLQNLLQLSMCFFMHVSEIKHSLLVHVRLSHVMAPIIICIHYIRHIVFPWNSTLFIIKSVICLWESLYCSVIVFISRHDPTVHPVGFSHL